MKRLKKATPFVVSLVLHSALLIFMLLGGMGGSGDGEGQGDLLGQLEQLLDKNGRDQTNPEVIEKIEVEMVEVKPQEIQSEGDVPVEVPPPEPPKEAITECVNDAWYGGIGIKQDWRSGIIDEVYSGYPAHKAGLKVGDEIMGVDGKRTGEIRGEPGTVVVLDIYRKSTNEALHLYVTRDKVCTLDKKEQAP